MLEPSRWPRLAWIPVVGGLAWLWCASSFGFLGFLFSVIPGSLLLASGVSLLLYPGDPRIRHTAALGGLLGVPLALPAFYVAGVGTGLVLVGLSALGFLTAGALSVQQQQRNEGVPQPRPSVGLSAQVAADDAILAFIVLTLRLPSGRDVERVVAEVEEARQMFADRGWLEKPEGYHQSPPALTAPRIREARAGRLHYEHLSFESGYEPHPEEPGRDRWLACAANRTAHAWVFRHPGAPRPWLVCIHGYQMGEPRIDLAAFQASRLHHQLGLNLAFPVLPLHGPRKSGRVSGVGFFGSDFLQSVHAEAQAMWDIRRLLSWIRSQGAPRVGVHGLSLGGYNTALLACLEPELACVVAGIPATDFQRIVWRHGPDLQVRYAEHKGMAPQGAREVMRVVSPLALQPKVPRERRAIYAAVADQLVPPDQVRDLWEHWERPRVAWYQGGHLSFRLHPEVDHLVQETYREAGLIDRASAPSPRDRSPAPPPPGTASHRG